MLMLKKVLICVLCFSLFSSPLFAGEEAAEGVKDDYQYYLLEPDIITNYIKPGKRIGFVRVTVELMVKSKSNYAILDEHEPLVRDRIITIFGEQNEQSVKSLTERDMIRQRCVDEVNELLYAESEKKPVEDILFTKYLYQ
jgi:flagellar FliL protein